MKNSIKNALIFFLVLVSASWGLAQELQVQSNVSSDRWISRSETVVLRLSRPLQPEDGKLAVLIGATDITDLFIDLRDSLSYTPSVLMLPDGESELIVSLVSPENAWREIARLPLKVRTRTGFEKATVATKMSMNNSGQIAEGHSPQDNVPGRETYQDFTGQANISSEHVRDRFAIRSQWDFVGADEEEQALRFGEKGDDAAQIDLSSYHVQFQSNQTELSVGHISHGRHRHLISSYGSRGLLFKSSRGSTLDFSMAAMNATNIVGWNNFTGLSKNRNRIYSATFGMELLKRQGGARIEGSFMKGSSLPFSGFNQGNVNDAEKSHGYGISVNLSDPSQRIRFEGGFARSRFTNPEDPFLSQGVDVVPVKEETKNARYADLNLGVLQNYSLSETWQANVGMNLRHERVDPLYRSLASYARADFLENSLSVNGNIGMISMQYSHNRNEDNLDEIPSILKTKTRSNTFSVNLPFATIFSKPTGPVSWMPTFSYNYSRTHQFGDKLPENSGFSEGHVPNQVSNSHNAGFDWSDNIWRFGYRLAYSSQDNRQPGRENADFNNLNNSLSFGLTPISRLDVNLDLAFENAENKESDRTDKTTNFALTMNLRTTQRSNLNATFSTTHSEDDAKTSSNNNLNFNAQWSYGFSFNRSGARQLLQGQFFIRYSRNDSDSKDTIFGFESDLSSWTINTGVNVSLF